MEEKRILLSILAMQICGIPCSVPQQLSQQQLEGVWKLAKAHDLAHIPGHYLGSRKDLPRCDALQAMTQEALSAVARYVQLNYEYQRACDALEQAKLPFIPLKGAVMRQYYPQNWMRTSCDVDILVDPKDLEAAAAVLVENCGYTRKGMSDHDISMYAPSGLHLELHYTVLDEARMPKTQAVLKDFWRHAHPVREGAFHHVVSDEMFYFFHIAHMAKHVENGGCGIRTFLDLWLLDHKVEHDEVKRQELLKKGGMLSFARAASKLSEIWLEDKPMDPMSLAFEELILHGGTYGTMDNFVAVRSTQKGGKFAYALSRIFLPYDTIKHYYPILKKHKWLTPVYQVVRWFKVAFKRRKNAWYELTTNAKRSHEEQASTRQLLDYLGL